MPIRYGQYGMLDRITHIDEELKRGNSINCTKLGKTFECGRKTIVRDITYMRERLDRPIEFDALRNTYYYSKPVGPLPRLRVGEGEVFALLVARKALEQYRGTPFHRQLATSFGKLTAALKEEVSFAPTDELQSVSFKHVGLGKADIEVFNSLNRGVTRQLEVTFDYRKPGATAIEQRRVRPYHLSNRENLWYLVGFDTLREALRTFALPRIAKVVVTDQEFTRPADFSAEAFFSKALGAFGGDRELRVVVRFTAAATADRIREREWHPSQKIRELPAGAIEVTLTLGALEEIERWVLGWGADAEVIEPPELRERLKKTAAELTKRYR